MKVVPIFPSDVDRVTEMFIERSAHMPYYAELAKQYGMETSEYINTVLKGQFEEILKLNQSFGIIDRDELTGYFLCFCIQHMQQHNKEVYNEIFKGAETLQNTIDNFVGLTCFIICTDIVGNRQARDISKLFRTAIEEIGGSYSFVTDIVPDDILKDVLDKNGFKYSEVNGYKLYIRTYSREW